MSQPQHGRDHVDALVSKVLGIPRDAVTEDVAFRSIPQWDSLRHVELMLALEERLGEEIGPDLIAELTSVRAIRAFDQRPPGGRVLSMPGPEGAHHAKRTAPLPRGLSGVEIDETSISHIDGEAGRLSYRGYSVEDLVRHSTFEETACLLLSGELPTGAELAAFLRELRTVRSLPDPVRAVIRELREAHPTVVLRTAISALAAFDPDRGDASAEAARRAGVRLIAQAPLILAEHHAARSGRPPTRPPAGRGHAERLLSLLQGPAHHAQILDRCMILLAEHGSNASAFAARVAIGTDADLHAAVTAAIAAFSGSLHGGAIEGVTEMVGEIQEPGRAGRWVRDARSGNRPILGLGHRLYRTEDPRAPHLREMARALSEESGDVQPFLILEEVRRAMRPHARYGLDVNVDFYAGLVLSMIGIPPDMLTAVFATSRMAGWIAQSLEQRANNVLIRPLLRYAGEVPRSYVPLAEREHGIGRTTRPTAGPA